GSRPRSARDQEIRSGVPKRGACRRRRPSADSAPRFASGAPHSVHFHHRQTLDEPLTTSVPAFTTALRRHAACCAIGTKRRLAGRRGITARCTYAAPPITIALRTGAGGSEANPYAERSGAGNRAIVMKLTIWTSGLAAIGTGG